MFQVLTRFYRGKGSSTEPSGGSKAEEVDAHDNVASPQHDLEPLTTQASLEDWRKKPAAKQALQEQDELSDTSDEQDDGDALPADDSIRGLTRTRSWVEKHSSLRKKRRLKELGSGNRAASPAEVPGPENGSISRAGELRLSEGVAPSQPVELSSPPHAGSQTAPTGVLTDSGFTNRSGTALGRKTPSNERAIVSSQQGDDPWKIWEAHYRSLSPTGEPPERQKMLVQIPKKLKTKPIKQQKDDKQLWNALEKALQGQLTQAILQ